MSLPMMGILQELARDSVLAKKNQHIPNIGFNAVVKEIQFRIVDA